MAKCLCVPLRSAALFRGRSAKTRAATCPGAAVGWRPLAHPPTLALPPPCAAQLGRPHVPVPAAPALPKGILVVAGAAGQSCDAACRAKNAACQPAHFVSLNDCNSLRAKFMCEAGEPGLGWQRSAALVAGWCCVSSLCPACVSLPCRLTGCHWGVSQGCTPAPWRCPARVPACLPASQPSLQQRLPAPPPCLRSAGCGAAAPDQREFPGYIEGSAPKQQKPAFCAMLPPLPGLDAPSFNCSRGVGSVRRLCPCEPLPPAEVQAAADGAAAAAQQAAGGVTGSAGAEAAAAQMQQQAAAAAAQQQPDAQAQEAAAQQQAAAVQQQEQQAAGAAALPSGDAIQQAVQPGGGVVGQQR